MSDLNIPRVINVPWVILSRAFLVGSRNRPKIFWVLMVAILCSFCTGCASTLSQRARDQNIRVVTHLKLVEGMTFIDGYTTQAGWIWGPNEIGNMAANDAAESGYSNVVVLVELVDPGQAGGQYSVGRQAVWKISIYQSSCDRVPEPPDVEAKQTTKSVRLSLRLFWSASVIPRQTQTAQET